MTTSRPIYPRDLLAQAERLVGRGAGAGRPRAIDLRGGVSRAYYAVFHEITSTAAEMLVDGDVSPDVPPSAFAVARWISHADVLRLAEAVGGRGNVALRAATAGADPLLSGACESFVALQGLRHLADYDHDFAVDRYGALTAVDDAESALDALADLWQRRDPSYRRFLRLAAGSVHIARSR